MELLLLSAMALQLKLMSVQVGMMDLENTPYLPLGRISVAEGAELPKASPTPQILRNSPFSDTSPSPILPPIFDRIGFCESGGISGRQYDDKGQVIIGPTNDVGKYQISQIHLPEAKRLGMDIFSEKGNEEFAFFLYQKNGLRDWESSKKCWGK